MSYPIYKINIQNEDTTLNFCLEGEMDMNERNNKCMNMYIYEDDTLIEVINKIKIGIINHIENFNEKRFEDLAGYLTAEWNYYEDKFKLKEYIHLNIFDTEKSTFENFNKKLEKINIKYDRGNLINIDDDIDNITINNIDFDKFEFLNETNEIVIGYCDRNNFYKYYITNDTINENISRNLENELMKPINNYYNIINENKINIQEFNFYIVDDDIFIKNNYIFMPDYLKNIEIKTFIEKIYKQNNENRIKLNNTYDNIFCDNLINNIEDLSLEINNYEKIDYKLKYNSIELNENMPLCLLSEKEGTKISKTYKLLKNRKNNLPFIKEEKLNKIIEETKKHKNFALFKIYFLKNGKKTTDFVDVYLIDENYYYIKFNNIISQKVKINDIIENINNVLFLLNLNISEKQVITLNDFYYYNDNNTILLNDDTNFNSNKINLIIKSSYISGSENESEKFLYFASIFHTYFDIEIQEPLKVEIKKEIKTLKETRIKIENKTVNNLNIEDGVKNIKLNQENKKLNDINNLKIINNSKIKLFYKKSYNYDSYNYIEKFFKYIITFSEKTLNQDFQCKETLNYYNFLKNFNDSADDKILDTEIDINGSKKNLRDLIEELKDSYMNKLTPSTYCQNIKKKNK